MAKLPHLIVAIVSLGIGPFAIAHEAEDMFPGERITIKEPKAPPSSEREPASPVPPCSHDMKFEAILSKKKVKAGQPLQATFTLVNQGKQACALVEQNCGWWEGWKFDPPLVDFLAPENVSCLKNTYQRRIMPPNQAWQWRTDVRVPESAKLGRQRLKPIFESPASPAAAEALPAFRLESATIALEIIH